MPLIAAYGDSTTAGTPGFTSPVEAPPDGAGNVESQFAYWLMQAHPDWRVLNFGVNGERSDQIRVAVRPRSCRHAPDVAIVLAGVNDIYQGRSADSVARELEAMYVAAASLANSRCRGDDRSVQHCRTGRRTRACMR